MVYSFIDVETPNKRNDRICSIGLVQVTDEGEVVNEQHCLVNPECRFDDINMEIHGIAPIDVKDAVTFPELWDGWLAEAYRVTKSGESRPISYAALLFLSNASSTSLRTLASPPGSSGSGSRP